MSTHLTLEHSVEVRVDEAIDDWDEAVVKIDWCISGGYTPAKVYGDPEDCYPAEYPEYEVNRIYIETEFGVFDLCEHEVMFNTSMRHERIEGTKPLRCKDTCSLCAFFEAEEAHGVLRLDYEDLVVEIQEHLDDQHDYDPY